MLNRRYFKVLLIIVIIYVLIETLKNNNDLISSNKENIENNITETIKYKQTNNMDKFNERHEEIQLKRKEIMATFCDIYEKEQERQYGISRRLIIDRKEEITWCPICKAGSSVWMKIFAILGGELNPDAKLPDINLQVSKLARKAYPFLGYLATIRALSSTVKFLIVRHPFERLLSAFRDKLEDANKTYYHNKFGKYIINWYRKEESDEIIPTFQEFLTYIVFEKSFDEHWNPYYKECAPCFMNYDIIIKMESFEDDHKYFINYLGIPEIELIERINKFDNTNRNGRTNEAIKFKYFSQIPLNLLKRIYEIYQKDFEMFDYKPDSYFLMAEKNV